jgi:hypothetical protein
MKYFLFALIVLGLYISISGIIELYSPTSIFIFGLQNFDYGYIAFPIAGFSLAILSSAILLKKFYYRPRPK